MRENFIKELESLIQNVLDMFADVRLEIVYAMEALMERDIQKAKAVFELDDETDKKMLEIEEKVIKLIALQAPLSHDFRMLFAVSKIVTDLERIGDYAVNTAAQTIQMNKEPFLKPIHDLPKMGDHVLQMLDLSKEAFEKKDAARAFRAGEIDEDVDNLYTVVYREILIKIHEDERNIDQGTRLLFIGRFLERMADHITNVCERIIYMVSGDILEIN